MKKAINSPKKIPRWWNWIDTENGRELRIEGAITEESWMDDEITPKQFKSELISRNGDITVYINSPGGDMFAAAQIYNMLIEYEGKVTVKIDGIAASAASVIAMAGTKVLVSPVSQIMIHNPMTAAFGDTQDMQKAIAMLSEIKESIINAYELKTGLRRSKISHLMDTETWMNAKKAVELGFADEILYANNNFDDEVSEGQLFSQAVFDKKVINKISKSESKITLESLQKRLSLLNH